MRLYLDDDTASPLLARLLRQAGHDIRLPVEVGLRGEHDAVHLTYAVRDDRVCLSKNHGDFRELHELALALRGHHPGILVIRKDSDRKRDLKGPDIVRAIGKLLASGLSLADGYFELNPWR
jgi:predicted nuclease of predicted toxin-antitoxin system